MKLPERPASDESVPARTPALLRRMSRPPTEMTELDVRDFMHLPRGHYLIDPDLCLLGFRTMKYQHKADPLAALPGFALLRPLLPEQDSRGGIEVTPTLRGRLCELTGTAPVSPQLTAGAQAERTALPVAWPYAVKRGKIHDTGPIPDSAHGTSPASTSMTMSGNSHGGVDLNAPDAFPGPQVLAFMLTNPGTAGLVGPHVLDSAARVHAVGGLMHFNGENFGAVVGIVDATKMGIDLMQRNLHKTFSRPAAGTDLSDKPLEPYLPVPVRIKCGPLYRLAAHRPQFSGRAKTFPGHSGILVRTLACLPTLGDAGLRETQRAALPDANSEVNWPPGTLDPPYPDDVIHELHFSNKPPKQATTVPVRDRSKRLLDHGFHTLTRYFPLPVDEAVRIETVESEIGTHYGALSPALETTHRQPDMVKGAPHAALMGRIDKVATVHVLLDCGMRAS